MRRALRHRYGRAKATRGRRVVLTIGQKNNGYGLEGIGEIRDAETDSLLKRGPDPYHYGDGGALADVKAIAKCRGYIIVEA